MSMGKKSKPDRKGYVYSTDPGFRFDSEDGFAETLNPSKQKLRIRLDTKRRAGKAVTVIEGCVGTEPDLEELCKKLKSFCGTGGSSKDREIIIQGDQREKIIQWLTRNGYDHVKKI
jgi:translation initiation factor 1